MLVVRPDTTPLLFVDSPPPSAIPPPPLSLYAARRADIFSRYNRPLAHQQDRKNTITSYH